MRVVSGRYKGRHFDVPTSFKARPTTDFAKENLFNVLQSNYVDFTTGPRALDLFAGTGSISLELLSRGCSEVVSVEKDRDHFRFLARTAKQLNDPAWQPLCADVFAFIKHKSPLRLPRGEEERFDLIFADPPYALPQLADLPRMLLDAALLAPHGLLIVEHGKHNDFSQLPEFVQQRRYGSVNFSFFIAPA